eukprot:10121-Eustigmatos_ZCMA.PRE.1
MSRHTVAVSALHRSRERTYFPSSTLITSSPTLSEHCPGGTTSGRCTRSFLLVGPVVTAHERIERVR